MNGVDGVSPDRNVVAPHPAVEIAADPGRGGCTSAERPRPPDDGRKRAASVREGKDIHGPGHKCGGAGRHVLMYPDDVRWFDGRWLALSEDQVDIGFVAFRVEEHGWGLSWNSGGLFGRIRVERPGLVVEEEHLFPGTGGRLVIHPDGFDHVVDTLDLSAPDLYTGRRTEAGVSVRWLTESEAAAKRELRWRESFDS